MSARAPRAERGTIAVRGLRKEYPSVMALDDVTLEIRPGEVIGIVGKNGAGKSTLIKVLCGAVSPDEGTIELDGEPVEFDRPSQALDRGIVAMHQQLEVFGSMTVAENLLLGTPNFPHGKLGMVRRAQLDARARETLAALKLDIDPQRPVQELSIAEQRMTNLARALVGEDGRLVILDEPTESLTAGETEQMFERVRQVRDAGLAVIYVSHRLDEVRGISDRIVAMRDGRVIASGDASEFGRNRLVELIAGEAPETEAEAPRERRGSETKAVLAATGLSGPALRPSTFQLNDGEIVGLCGLVGSGRSTLARTLAGAVKADSGEVLLDGEPVEFSDPGEAIARGVVHVPEDRREQALFESFTIAEDTSIGDLEKHRWRSTPFLSGRAQAATAARAIKEFGVSAAGGRQLTRTLSGGNQQKVVLARWMIRGGRVLILDEPTQGIDVGTRKEILNLVRSAVDQGSTALWISSDFQELLDVSDRILVMKEHQVVADMSPAESTEEELLRSCLPSEEYVHAGDPR